MYDLVYIIELLNVYHLDLAKNAAMMQRQRDLSQGTTKEGLAVYLGRYSRARSNDKQGAVTYSSIINREHSSAVME